MLTKHATVGAAIKHYRLIANITLKTMGILLEVSESRACQLEAIDDLKPSSRVILTLKKIGITRCVDGWQVSLKQEDVDRAKSKNPSLLKKKARRDSLNKINEAKLAKKQAHERVCKQAQVKVIDILRVNTSEDVAKFFNIGIATVSAIKYTGRMSGPVAKLIVDTEWNGGNVTGLLATGAEDRSRSLGPVTEEDAAKYENSLKQMRAEDLEARLELLMPTPPKKKHKATVHVPKEMPKMARPVLKEQKQAAEQTLTPTPKKVSVPFVDPSVPIIPVLPPITRGNEVTKIVPHYEPCSHCGGSGKVMVDTTVTVEDTLVGHSHVHPRAQKLRDLPEGYVGKTEMARRERIASGNARRLTREMNSKNTVEKLATTELRELILQNKTRRQNGMKEIVLAVKRCLTCSQQFESLGNRMCKSCRHVEVPSIQGLDFI